MKLFSILFPKFSILLSKIFINLSLWMVKPLGRFASSIFVFVVMSLCLSITNPNNVVFAADHSGDSSSTGALESLSSRASTPSSSFFRGLSDAAPAPELGEEVLQVSPTISQSTLWDALSPSAPPKNNQPPLGGEQATPDPAPQEVRDFLHQRIKSRLSTLTPQREVNDDQVDAIICLKEEIVDRMAQLDHDPFWADQKNHLVAHGILNKGAEYTISSLEKNLEKLRTAGPNSLFFKKLMLLKEKPSN